MCQVRHKTLPTHLVPCQNFTVYFFCEIMSLFVVRGCRVVTWGCRVVTCFWNNFLCVKSDIKRYQLISYHAKILLFIFLYWMYMMMMMMMMTTGLLSLNCDSSSYQSTVNFAVEMTTWNSFRNRSPLLCYLLTDIWKSRSNKLFQTFRPMIEKAQSLNLVRGTVYGSQSRWQNENVDKPDHCWQRQQILSSTNGSDCYEP